MKTSRRAFVKSGLLFVPSLLRAQLPIFPLPTASNRNGLLNGLISYWKFENASGLTAVDSHGTNDLTLSGGASSGFTSGIINTGLDIGAGGSYAEHASSTDFAMGSGVSWSYSFWISSSNFAASGSLNVHFLGKGDDSNNNDEYLVLVSAFTTPINQVLFYAWDTNGTVKSLSLSPAGAPSNTWHHVVIGFDAAISTQIGYFDGAALTPNVMTSNGIRTSSSAFRMGEWTGIVDPSLPNQKLDECGLWHRALSAADVTYLYNAGAALPLSAFTT